MLNSSANADQTLWLQNLLLRSWLAHAESKFPGILPRRQPFCLMALEDQKAIGILLLHPYNRRGTCWSIDFTKPFTEPTNCSLKDAQIALIQKAFDHGNESINSWVVRCGANDEKQLSILRELGFQPLKLLEYWSPTKDFIQTAKEDIGTSLPRDLQWQRLSRENAPNLWSLEQSSLSSHLRQILDRQWKDVLNKNKSSCGVLLNSNPDSKTALLGLTSYPGIMNNEVVQLVRDIAWDHRLTNALPIILRKLPIQSEEFQLEISSDDQHIKEVLEALEWRRDNEKLLLGRSLWRRQSSPRVITKAKPLESMLGRLQPQQRQLPTPSLERR